MIQYKQNPDFLHIGKRLLEWYAQNGRDLPFRHTKEPYKVWISEIVFQQTRVEQGLEHYILFVERFPSVDVLANAEPDEVLMYWKGLGYYSRALNIHKAAQQIMNTYGGKFPSDYTDILQLKGIGKYTAAAISSISFGLDYPAVDGNFYRVLSRFFGDEYDISSSGAFDYFVQLALRLMPKGKGGEFNQAMMDLGAIVCKPKNPLCGECPIQQECVASLTGNVSRFPVKKKKVKVNKKTLTYYFVQCGNRFLVQQRDEQSIWKKLFEFPTQFPEKWQNKLYREDKIEHSLSHLKLEIILYTVKVENSEEFRRIAHEGKYEIISLENFSEKAFPKPLENFLNAKMEDSC